jgi:hypothetical protein
VRGLFNPEGLWSFTLAVDGILGNNEIWSTKVTTCLQSAKLARLIANSNLTNIVTVRIEGILAVLSAQVSLCALAS